MLRRQPVMDWLIPSSEIAWFTSFDHLKAIAIEWTFECVSE